MEFPAAADSQPIQQDVACSHCGYNLRGLPSHGRCPECDAENDLSLRGDYLYYANAEWVLRLSRGARLAALGVGIGIVDIALVFFFHAAVEIGWLSVGWIVAGLLFVAGAWQMTQPDPSGNGESLYGTARQIARVCLAIGLIEAVLRFPIQPTLTKNALSLATLNLMLRIVTLIGQIALLNYLSKLAVRIPAWDLSRRARRLAWVFAGMFGASILLQILVGLAPTLGMRTPTRATLTVGLAGSVVLGACVEVELLRLLISLARQLRREAMGNGAA